MANDGNLTAQAFQQQDGVTDWRALDVGATAWYATPTQSSAAQLVERIVAQDGDPDRLPDLDLRPGGIRVRVGRSGQLTTVDAEVARFVSATAADLGLKADPSILQAMQVTLDAVDRSAVMPFWAGTLGYAVQGDEDLTDPLRRDPSYWFQQMDAPRPLRNRIHADISRPGKDLIAAALAAGGRHLANPDGSGPHGDVDGNEADLIPGWALGDDPDYADWEVVFGAMVGYRVDSPAKAAELMAAVAELTDVAGMPLMIDYRPDHGLVIIDTGKDGWEDERFADLARGIQSAARRLGLSADPAPLRFVQFGIDAADVTTVREFWRTTLGYVEDPRPVTDIYDPRRLNPPLFFQQIDTSETERLRQRNRLHFDVFVPDDQLQARLDAAVAAGGVISYDAMRPAWCTVTDPEGNELDFAVSVGREEAWAASSTTD